MPAFHVGPGQYYYIPITVPRTGRLRISVDADGPINAYLTSPEEFRRYDRDGDFDYLWNVRRRSSLRERLSLPTGGEWILVIESWGKSIVGGALDVS